MDDRKQSPKNPSLPENIKIWKTKSQTIVDVIFSEFVNKSHKITLISSIQHKVSIDPEDFRLYLIHLICLHITWSRALHVFKCPIIVIDFEFGQSCGTKTGVV